MKITVFYSWGQWIPDIRRGVRKLRRRRLAAASGRRRMAAVVVPDVKSVVTEARDTFLGAVTSTVTGAVSGVVGLAARAIQGSIDAVQSVVCTVKESRVGQFVTSSVDTVLGKTEEWVDHNLPMTDEELSQLASTVEGFEVPPLQQQKKRRSYYVLLGSLSSRIRHRAYQHSLGKVRNAQASTTELLAQLHQTFDLVESLNRNIEGGKENLHQLSVDESRWSSKPGSSAECGYEDQTFDSRMLSMTQMMTIQLQITCLALVSGAQGLPANIHEHMQQLKQNVLDLHTLFSVRSLCDVSSGILAQSREKATKVNEHVNELLGYVRANTPLTWVVGPFTPSD